MSKKYVYTIKDIKIIYFYKTYFFTEINLYYTFTIRLYRQIKDNKTKAIDMEA